MSRQGAYSSPSRNDYNAYTPYRGNGGYQVSSGALYVPEPSRDESSSSLSSARSSSPQHPANYGSNGMNQYDSYESYRQQARIGVQQPQRQPPQYSQYPSQAAPPTTQHQSRMPSAYPQNPQTSSSPATSKPSIPRRPLPGVPQAQVSLDGRSHDIPVPPTQLRSSPGYNSQVNNNNTHNYTQTPSYNMPEQQFYSSRQQNDSNTSLSAGQNPFQDSHSSQLSLAAAAATPNAPANLNRYQDNIDRSHLQPNNPYQSNHLHNSGSAENIYRHSMGNRGAPLGSIDPTDIDDDDDDPFPSGSRRTTGAIAGSGAAAATAAAATTNAQRSGPGGFLKGLAPRDASGTYGQVPGGSVNGEEKRSDWLNQQTHRNKRVKWMVIGLIVVVIVLAIIGGVVGAVLSNKSSSSSSDPGGISASGSLTKDSPQIQALLNNPKLHKVFPGMDYSPLNTQYPECLTNPPVQNYVTADLAIISQLTPIIRLYGTDCNATELVLNGIKDLGLTDSMKVWGGIYLDSNTTTNNRQIQQMYSVLDKYGGDQFEGVIVGNEVLFSEYMTESQLIGKIDEVRSEIRSRGLSSLKVATGDLGSVWNSRLAEASDVLMANIHPFFGGVEAPQAASWTLEFWQNNDLPLISGMAGKSGIIAETGWPSGGGNYCTDSQGANMTCASNTSGAVAGISEMQTFMNGWVCSSLEKGTEYFWFEAFNEPWKRIFDTKSEHWEQRWGLFNVDRSLKSGLTIPDCGGKVAQLRD